MFPPGVLSVQFRISVRVMASRGIGEIFVGSVRGADSARGYFSTPTFGHQGYWAVVHAGGVRAVDSERVGRGGRKCPRGGHFATRSTPAPVNSACPPRGIPQCTIRVPMICPPRGLPAKQSTHRDWQLIQSATELFCNGVGHSLAGLVAAVGGDNDQSQSNVLPCGI